MGGRRLAALLSVVVITFAQAGSAGEVPAGRHHVEVSGFVDGLAIAPTEDSRGQHPQGLANLRFDGEVTPNLRGHLELRGRVGGPYDRDDAVAHQGVYNLVHEFQQYSPALEVPEAYARLLLGRLDARVGIQRFAWGKLDGVPPTDVLNPRDFHDPIVTDAEEAKIGIPALQLAYNAPDVARFGIEQPRAALVYAPLAVPSRLPRIGERWFPQTLTPTKITLNDDDLELFLERAITRRCRRKTNKPRDPFCDPPVDVDVVSSVRITPTLRTANRRPPLRFAEGGIGGRLGWTWRAMDWTVYHYSGPETGPNADLDSVVSTPSLGVAPSPREVDLSHLRVDIALRQTHTVVHMTGFDWSASLGGATVRTEAAFFQDRPYLRIARDLVSRDSLRHLRLSGSFLDQALGKNGCSAKRPCRGAVDVGPLFPRLDSIEWGAGVDYLIYDVFALLQVNQSVLRDDAPRLVVSDPETRVTVVVRRRFLVDRLEVEVRSAVTLERSSGLVFPRVSYQLTDGLRVRVGYLAISGTRDSLIGEFRQNDEFVFQLRYSF